MEAHNLIKLIQDNVKFLSLADIEYIIGLLNKEKGQREAKPHLLSIPSSISVPNFHIDSKKWKEYVSLKQKRNFAFGYTYIPYYGRDPKVGPCNAYIYNPDREKCYVLSRISDHVYVGTANEKHLKDFSECYPDLINLHIMFKITDQEKTHLKIETLVAPYIMFFVLPCFAMKGLRSFYNLPSHALNPIINNAMYVCIVRELCFLYCILIANVNDLSLNIFGYSKGIAEESKIELNQDLIKFYRDAVSSMFEDICSVYMTLV